MEGMAGARDWEQGALPHLLVHLDVCSILGCLDGVHLVWRFCHVRLCLAAVQIVVARVARATVSVIDGADAGFLHNIVRVGGCARHARLCVWR